MSASIGSPLPSRCVSVFTCERVKDLCIVRAQFFAPGSDGRRGRLWKVEGRSAFRADMNLFKVHCGYPLECALRLEIGSRSALVLSRRASGEICHVMYPQACGDLAQALSAGGEESAEQPATSQLFEPGPPGLGTALEPIEDSRYLRRDRGLPIAEETPRVLEQHQKEYLSGDKPASSLSMRRSGGRGRSPKTETVL